MNFLKLLANAFRGQGRRGARDGAAEAPRVREGVSATSRGNAAAMPPSFPSKDGFLKRIIAVGIPVSAIVDVGVREGTYELVANFPRLKHHLFEPAKHCFEDIARNYRDVDHVLHARALGSSNELRYLVSWSLGKDGMPTHSGIVGELPQVDGLSVVAAEEFRIERFDGLNIGIADDFLLKVDVDGLDTEVLKGFGERIQKASVVIVESTTAFVAERTALLQAAGFVLVDIVDLAYYGPSLYQLDLCFVRSDLVSEKLRPDVSHFDGALWNQISQPSL